MNWMTIIVILFLAACITEGFVKGFMKMVYAMFAGILIFVIAIGANSYVTNFLVERTTIDTQLEDVCYKQIQGMVKDQGDGSIQILQRLLELEEVEKVIWGEQGICAELAKQLALIAVKAMAFLITFVVISILVRVPYKFFNIIEKLPGVRMVNRGLGATIGMAKGLVYVWLVFAIVAMMGTGEYGQMLIMYIYESPILVLLFENNFILALIMKLL